MMSESQRSVGLQQIPDAAGPSGVTPFSIQGTMAKFLWTMILMVGCAQAQVAAPAASYPTSDDTAAQPTAAAADGMSPVSELAGKVGLVRGVLKRLDPIHDQLLIHAFGGGDIRIAFDARTQLLPENTGMHLMSLPAGSVVSVDTVIDNGKLFARAVRTSPSNAVELNGQVVRYDAAKSQLTLRYPMSPKSVALRITSGTVIVNRGQPGSPQDLSAGMLVRVQFSPAQSMANNSVANNNVANNVEILAERGNSFTFEGRIVAVDLRARVLALSNDSDQAVRELAIGSLDTTSLRLLREGADVSIQDEFDGDRYNVRTVTLVSRNP
jgi:hypothetical protein